MLKYLAILRSRHQHWLLIGRPYQGDKPWPTGMKCLHAVPENWCSASFVTDPASLKIAGEDRQAMLAPAIAAAKAGDIAGAARLVPIGVNNQPDFWDAATPDTRAMFADNARTIPLAFSLRRHRRLR